MSTSEPERLRDEGIARVTANSDQTVIDAIDHAISLYNRLGVEWSVNDVREVCAEIHRAKPQLIGARVRAAAMRKEMVRVGYEPSTLPSTHAHPIAIWRGVS